MLLKKTPHKQKHNTF